MHAIMGCAGKMKLYSVQEDDTTPLITKIKGMRHTDIKWEWTEGRSKCSKMCGL